jgi:hypothetical protein
MAKPDDRPVNLADDLDELFLIILEVDAYHHATSEQFSHIAWDGAMRRDLQRLDVLMRLTSATIAKLVGESRTLVEAAMKQRPR